MIIYGKSGITFAKDLFYDETGKDQNKTDNWDKAKKKGLDLVRDYLNTFYGLKNWLNQTKEFARKNGYVKTMFGFYRRLPDIHSKVNRLRSNAERQAINAPIQGSGSTFTLLSVINICNEFKKRNLDSKVVATVHDSICVDARISEVAEVCRIIKSCMESAHKVRIDTPVPIVADGELGDRYGRVFEVSLEESDSIHTKEDFNNWIHSKCVDKYKGEIKILRKEGKSTSEIKKWLIDHDRMKADYPEIYEYLESE